MKRKPLPAPTGPAPPEPTLPAHFLALNENVLLDSLSKPALPQNIDELMIACALTLMDGYDRKMTRDEFGDLVTHSLNFTNRMVRMSVAHNLIRAFDDGSGPGTSELKIFREQHRVVAEELRNKLVSTLKLLMECRAPGTPVS